MVPERRLFVLHQNHIRSPSSARTIIFCKDNDALLGMLAIRDPLFIADRVMGGRSLALSSILLLLTSISIVAFAELSTAGPTVVSAAMCLVGFFIAGPDATLGGGAAKTICEINGEGGLAAKTASGIVNGMGSLGPVLQGYLTAYMVENFGAWFSKIVDESDALLLNVD